MISKRTKICVLILAIGAGALGSVLFVPPIRDKFFTTSLWPWPLPWDVTEKELAEAKALSLPGDVVVESNLHAWQWILLSLSTTGTTWVHASLVDDDKKLLTVHVKARELDWPVYLEWQSTRMALIRPPYKSQTDCRKAIDYARSKLDLPYDPSFKNPDGNCSGLVADSLNHAGFAIQPIQVLDTKVYPTNCFFSIPNARVIWQQGN